MQGQLTTDLPSDPSQRVVEIPLTLVPELAAHKHKDLHLTNRVPC